MVYGLITGAELQPGAVFLVSREWWGVDGLRYLKLADGRGWVFEAKHGASGLRPMCELASPRDITLGATTDAGSPESSAARADRPTSQPAHGSSAALLQQLRQQIEVMLAMDGGEQPASLARLREQLNAAHEAEAFETDDEFEAAAALARAEDTVARGQSGARQAAADAIPHAPTGGTRHGRKATPAEVAAAERMGPLPERKGHCPVWGPDGERCSRCYRPAKLGMSGRCPGERRWTDQAHASHRLFTAGHVLFCMCCGRYADERCQLRTECKGAPHSTAAEDRRRRLRSGKHPMTGADLGAPAAARRVRKVGKGP